MTVHSPLLNGSPYQSARGDTRTKLLPHSWEWSLVGLWLGLVRTLRCVLALFLTFTQNAEHKSVFPFRTLLHWHFLIYTLSHSYALRKHFLHAQSLVLFTISIARTPIYCFGHILHLQKKGKGGGHVHHKKIKGFVLCKQRQHEITKIQYGNTKMLVFLSY